ncbi:MAG: MarR family transcriptional regulator [Marinosulfonomonas sp.]|nr:MarR family transcriptional regulator [Marinosulfonomonas sp.]
MEATNKKNSSKQAYTDGSLATACVRGRHAVISHFTEFLAEIKMSEQQWRSIRTINDFEPIRLSVLCQRTCIHKVSMTRIIRALTQRGLVLSQPDLSDGRAQVITVTEEGKKFIRSVSPQADQITGSVVKKFGRENTKRLLDLLDQLSRIEP